jgi:hypothetical protein
MMLRAAKSLCTIISLANSRMPQATCRKNIRECLRILARVARFFRHSKPKWWKRDQITTKLPNGRNIFQMAKEYANLFHSKALQNLPKLGFLV